MTRCFIFIGDDGLFLCTDETRGTCQKGVAERLDKIVPLEHVESIRLAIEKMNALVAAAHNENANA